MNGLVLGAIGVELGTPTPVSALSDELDPTSRENVEREFDEVYIADCEIRESAIGAALKSRDSSNEAPDLLVYISEGDRDRARSMACIANSLDIPSATRIAMSGHDCGNLAPALQVIKAMIESGQAEQALLVLSDHAEVGQRRMRNGMSIFSDGALAAMISAKNDGSARFDPIVSIDEVVVAPILGEFGPVPSPRAVAHAVRAAASALHGRAQVGCISLAHYREQSRAFLHAASGLEWARLSRPPLLRKGHFFASDQLLGIANEKVAESTAIISVGTWSCSAVLVRRADLRELSGKGWRDGYAH